MVNIRELMEFRGFVLKFDTFSEIEHKGDFETDCYDVKVPVFENDNTGEIIYESTIQGLLEDLQ